MKHIFKKNTVIYSEKVGIAVLLAEDFDYDSGKLIQYKQWWNVYVKPHKRGKPIVSQQYDDWCGGLLPFGKTDCFHLAPKKLIKMLNIPDEELTRVCDMNSTFQI